MSSPSKIPAHYILSDFKVGLKAYKDAIPFIRKHRLWEGFEQTKWLKWLLLLFALGISIPFFLILLKWVKNFLFGLEMLNPVLAGQHISDLGSNLLAEGKDLFSVGSFKYIVVICTKVFIAHFGGRTLEILTKVPYQPTFKGFLSGQTRTIKVVIRKFFKEIIATIFLMVVFALLPWFVFLKPLAIFAVQCYFLGLVILDGCIRSKRSIKESTDYIAQYAGLSIAIGWIFYLLLFIPIVGVLIAPSWAAVAATLGLYRLEKTGITRQTNE